MSYIFFGESTDFWSVMGDIGTIVNAGIVIVTGVFLYKQLKIGVTQAQFSGVLAMQNLIDSFSKERTEIFKTFPSDLVLTTDQFPEKPPNEFSIPNYSAEEKTRMKLTKKQELALEEINKNEEKIQLSRKVIGKLNDLAQLAEDGLMDKKIFLGKYHLMIIRLCYILEPIRRSQDHGGNYGQRLLRLRQMAINYNTIIPKHRNKDITIEVSGVKIIIVPAKKNIAYSRNCYGIINENSKFIYKSLPMRWSIE